MHCKLMPVWPGGSTHDEGLNSSAHDSDGLRRLDGSYGRETANSAAVADVAGASAQHLSGMQAALQAAVQAQRQRSASVTSALDAFVQKNISDVAALKVRLHAHTSVMSWE